MKKYFLYLTTGLLSLTFIPNVATAATAPVKAIADPAQSQIALVSRLNEISMIDQSEMTRDQKKELRQEERSIKTSMADGSGGIYISVVGLLLIILILIILL